MLGALILFREQGCYCSSLAVFDEPKPRTIGRDEHLQVVNAVVLHCLVLQDAQARNKGVLAECVDRFWSCQEGFVLSWHKSIARVGIVEGRFLGF